ncbi:MAG: flagellar hook-basal body complex protein [Chloroflexi bacterium]|nr:flagellar hook-basal body complex protein [Chloroflexota bacterium]
MMRSLFAAISGLKNHQTMMDVVGNNISNVNTTGFKGARITFQDIISQTLRQASGASARFGNQNPIQVGLGSQISGIDTLLAQGALQSTGRPTDLAIQGDGFFVLSDNATTPTYFFTRDGNFGLGVAANVGDPLPLIHSATGLHVKGYVPPQANGTADSPTPPATDLSIPSVLNNVAVTGFTIDTNGIVNLTLADGTVSTGYAQLSLATLPNPEGMDRSGSNMFAATAASGPAAYNGARAFGRGDLNTGYLESSNVDLATQFTNMIIAERGFQANSRVITASDEVLQDLVNIRR